LACLLAMIQEVLGANGSFRGSMERMFANLFFITGSGGIPGDDQNRRFEELPVREIEGE